MFFLFGGVEKKMYLVYKVNDKIQYFDLREMRLCDFLIWHKSLSIQDDKNIEMFVIRIRVVIICS